MVRLAVRPRFLVLAVRAVAALRAGGNAIRKPHVGLGDFEHHYSFFEIMHPLCGVHTRLRRPAVCLARAHGGRNFMRVTMTFENIDRP
jgi:hypothetical protein